MKKLLIKTTIVLALVPSMLGIDKLPATKYDTAEVQCLAKNIYYEARGESTLGKLAVAQVTINRAKNSSICSEVYKPNQFSWTKAKPTAAISATDAESVRLLRLAEIALSGQHPLYNFPATYFHAKTSNPEWKYKLKKVATFGNHVFYKL